MQCDKHPNMKTTIPFLFLLAVLASCSEAGIDPKRERARKLINSKLINFDQHVNSSLHQFSESRNRPIRDSIAHVIFGLVSSDDDLLGMYLSSPWAIYYSDQFDSWAISADRNVLFEDSTLNKEMRIGDLGYGTIGSQNGSTKTVRHGQLNVDNYSKIHHDVMLVRYTDKDSWITLDLFYKLDESFKDKFNSGNWGVSNAISTFDAVKLERIKNN